MFLGGGYGDNRAIGRQIYENVPAGDVPLRIEQLLRAYLAHRRDDEETFRDFSRRHTNEALVAMTEQATAAIAVLDLPQPDPTSAPSALV